MLCDGFTVTIGDVGDVGYESYFPVNSDRCFSLQMTFELFCSCS